MKAFCFALLLSPGCFAAEPLRLVVSLGGRDYDRFVVRDGRIDATPSGAARPLSVPDHAKWRLEGDPRKHAPLVSFSIPYQIVQMAERSGLHAPEPRWQAAIAVPAARLHGPWNNRDLTDAIVVVGWLQHDRVVRVAAVTTWGRNDDPRAYAAATALPLDAEMRAGMAIALLYKDGQFLPPEAVFRSAAANAARFALFGNDREGFREELHRLPRNQATGQRGYTLLHDACHHGFDWALPQLLESNLFPDGRTRQSTTLLRRALGAGRVTCLDLLITAGWLPTPERTHELIDEALQLGQLDSAWRLTREIGFTPAESPRMQRLVDLATRQSRIDILHEIAAANGAELLKSVAPASLIACIARRDVATVQLLLDHGHPASASGPRTWSPLHEAICTGSVDLVDRLLSAHAPVNVANSAGQTPLMLAARRGRRDFVERLLSAGASVGTVDAAGATVLHHALMSDSEELLDLLLTHGAMVAVRDGSGRSALDRALELQLPRAVTRLLAAGAEMRLQWNETDRIVLGTAALDRVELLELAAARGWDPNATLANRWHPVHLAAYLSAPSAHAWLQKQSSATTPPPEIAPLASVRTTARFLPTNRFPENPHPPDQTTERATVVVTGIVERDGRMVPLRVEGTAPAAVRLGFLDYAHDWQFLPAYVGGVRTAAESRFTFTLAPPTERVFEPWEVDTPPQPDRSPTIRPPVYYEYYAMAAGSPPSAEFDRPRFPYVADPLDTGPRQFTSATMPPDAEVTAVFVIERDGSVSELFGVAESDSRYHANVARAVQNTRYVPAMKDGRPVRVRMVQRHFFRNLPP